MLSGMFRTLTRDTLEGIDVDVGIKLSWTEGLTGIQVTGDALGGRAVRACRGGSRQPILRLRLLLYARLLQLLLLPLCPPHVVDAQQQAVVHDLQLNQELQEPSSMKGF